MHPNPLLIHKYGGAALADRQGLERAAALAARCRAAGRSLCIVVSASGDTTDDLLQRARELGAGAADRDTDALLACGESISAALLAMHLRRCGIPARSLSGAQAGIVTDGNHGDADVLHVDPRRIVQLLVNGIVPVVAGFQGTTLDGDVTTLGRGGSDLTAVLLGAAVQAEAVELYKDVRGVCDADPAEHPHATVHDELDHDQLLAIVQRSAHAVVQPKAVVAARDRGVTLRVLPFDGTGDGDGNGTIVRTRTADPILACEPSPHRTAVFEAVESAVRSYCRSFPTVFARAKNAHLFDESGRAYIDFFAGAGALNYGHNPDFIQRRLIEHLQRDAVTHALDMFTTTKREFLEHFREVVLAPRGLDHKVQFCGPTGANSVEAAMKLARLVTRRVPIAAFTGGWHGMTAGCLSVTGNKDNRAGAGAPLPFTITLPYPAGPYELADALGYVSALFDDPNSGLDLPAALILETIQAEGGIWVAPVEWLRGIRELCDRHGVLMIVDEIQVGCGRAGTFFSFERAGIVPDLICLSKSIGGYGLPMSLLLIRPEFDIWKPGQHNGTFRGNQLAFCAAKEALSLWRDRHFEARIAERSALVRRSIEENVLPLHTGIELRGMGLIHGVDFTNAGGAEVARRIAQRCFQNGLIVERCGRDDTALKIMPPLTIELETLRQGLAILAAAAREVVGGQREDVVSVMAAVS
ncbi:MAG: diaminobutyrate--2-oxoglutarate transaminase [Planctomycetes bacterium]|nr:diaminobutyrate--2-oxoglutarate transaminase [Planctomycetota bacterium]